LSNVNPLPTTKMHIERPMRNGGPRVNRQPSIAEQLFPHLALQPGERVLDLYCGTGSATRMAAQAVAGGAGMAAGLDPSPERIAQARSESREVENLLFATGDAEEIPWRDEYFDKIFSLLTFGFDKSRQEVLRELHRVLVPGGLLHFVISPGGEGDYGQALRDGGFAETTISEIEAGGAMLLLVARKP
jgi:ubiquinone/menaquinone biosynthesis C-methylase UbiE